MDSANELTPASDVSTPANYEAALSDISHLLEAARRAAARSVNALMTATYWQIGRRIVEVEQAGQERAVYGTRLLKRLSADLTSRFGRGFSERNLEQMRLFYQGWQISQTLSAKSLPTFPLPWSHYVKLLRVQKPEARTFMRRRRCAGGGRCGS